MTRISLELATPGSGARGGRVVLVRKGGSVKISFWRRLLAVLAASLFLVGCSHLIVEGGQVVLNASSALRQDAEHYARDQNISVDEAVRRLKLQPALGKLDAQLAQEEPETYAGSWIQHQPEYGFVVNVTGNVEELSAYLQNAPFAELLEVRKVTWSLKQLEAAQRRAGDVAQALGLPFESGINIFENQAELYVADLKAFDAALKSNPEVKLPGGVVVIETGSFSSPE